MSVHVVPNMSELRRCLAKKWIQISSKMHLAVNKSMHYIVVILLIIFKLDTHTRIHIALYILKIYLFCKRKQL